MIERLMNDYKKYPWDELQEYRRKAKMENSEIEAWKASAERAEAERDALKCCGNCDLYAMRFSAFETDGANLNLLCAVRRDGVEKNTPWHYCDEWKAREK